MSVTIRTVMILGLFLFLAAGCASDSEQQTELQEMKAELAVLQQQVDDLKQTQTEIEVQHEKDITGLREDMKNLLVYMNISLDNLTETKSFQERLGEMSEEAKKKTLSGLKGILKRSQEMIDTLQKEIDESLEESN